MFRPLDAAVLQRLDDDALIEYMRKAREAGHASAALGLAILVYGHWQNVERRVRMKIPAAHVEDLTGDVIADAIESAFEGRSVGEEASAFAAALLMPQWLFVREHARCGGDVAALERAFGTSVAATERRVLALFGDS